MIRSLWKSFARRRTAGIPLLILLFALLAGLPACRSSTRAKEHVEKGNQALAQNRATDAETEYQQAIQIDPDLADAHYRLGVLELLQEHPTAATKSLSRAVELDPEFEQEVKRLWNFLGIHREN